MPLLEKEAGKEKMEACDESDCALALNEEEWKRERKMKRDSKKKARERSQSAKEKGSLLRVHSDFDADLAVEHWTCEDVVLFLDSLGLLRIREVRKQNNTHRQTDRQKSTHSRGVVVSHFLVSIHIYFFRYFESFGLTERNSASTLRRTLRS
jgi:hypothetical protein